MGWLNIFKRTESVDDALVAVAAQQGWTALPATGLAMLPPSHAAADVHGLGRPGAPACAGRAYSVALPGGGPTGRRTATLSHLEVNVSDEVQECYDLVVWSRTPGTVPRFEAELGAAGWNHHRLADRFGQVGHATTRRADGVLLRLARNTDPDRAQALTGHPAWGTLIEHARGAALGGCVAEGLGDRLAVFTWAGLARGERRRWLDLVALAQGLDALVN